MRKTTTSPLALTSKTEMTAALEEARDAAGGSFEPFCLIAGLSSLTRMLGEDTDALAGAAHARDAGKPGCRWGRAKGRPGFHAGKVELERPRVRSRTTGKEMMLPSWQEAVEGGWLPQWAISLMLMNVSTRKFGRLRSPAGGRRLGAGRIGPVEVRGVTPLQGAERGAVWPSGWRPACRSPTFP